MAVTWLLSRMTAKSATAATALMPITMLASRGAVMTPVTQSTTIAATAATAMAIQRPRSAAGSGLGTTRLSAGSALRPMAYCTRPKIMPIAASPKPTWKPHCFCSSPVSSGPTRAPRLMPR